MLQGHHSPRRLQTMALRSAITSSCWLNMAVISNLNVETSQCKCLLHLILNQPKRRFANGFIGTASCLQPAFRSDKGAVAIAPCARLR